MKATIFLRFPLIVVILLTLQNEINAQSFVDNALLFSRTNAGGSARIQGIGGAQVSLGGDFSSALSNPAGLGMYNRSEVSLGTAITLHNTSASYLGNNNKESKPNLNIPSLSLVFHHDTNREKGFLGGGFSISLTRINDLHQDYLYQGNNSNSSIIDYFKQSAVGLDPNSMLYDNNGAGSNYYNITSLAYNNYLIQDNVDGDGFYYTSALDPLAADANNPAEIRTVKQQESVERKGAQYQWSIAYGGNISDKFFFGGNVGLTTLRYKLEQQYSESNFSFNQTPLYKPLDNFKVNEYLDISGSGVNLTAGAIYRPIKMFQVGVSIVTPTFYQINDRYKASIKSQWNNFDYFNDGKPINDVSENFLNNPVVSKYNLTTPFKFSTGATLITKYGFLSGDVEFVNYGSSKYSSDTEDVSFREDNSQIRSTYSSVINYRVGAEFRHDIFRVRAGYNLMADPYKNSDNINRKVQSISGGFGIRTKEFFIDMAVVNSQSSGSRIPYTASGYADPVAKLDFKKNNIVFTVGYIF